jgi:DNA-directed RNA polymerase subunit RPC12/RpoP
MTMEVDIDENIKDIECISCNKTNLITSSDAYDKYDILYCYYCDTETYIIDSIYNCRNCGREIEEDNNEDDEYI